jgi:hypothetical protein
MGATAASVTENTSNPGGDIGPLTLPGYITAALAERQRRGSDQWSPVHVQVRKQGVVSCATVRDAREGLDGGGAFFLVDSDHFGQVWCNGRQVRLCSGDGRCTCEEIATRDEKASQ